MEPINPKTVLTFKDVESFDDKNILLALINSVFVMDQIVSKMSHSKEAEFGLALAVACLFAHMDKTDQLKVFEAAIDITNKFGKKQEFDRSVN